MKSTANIKAANLVGRTALRIPRFKLRTEAGEYHRNEV